MSARIRWDKMAVGDLRVWWIPQVPGKMFLVANNIKPDYANAGGLQILDEDSEWVDWYDDESGEDFDEYRDRVKL